MVAQLMMGKVYVPSYAQNALIIELLEANLSNPSMGNPVDVFISYSRKDEELKDELYVHLAPLIRQGQIKPWQDRAIEAGSEWDQEIKARLESAEIILLLVTPRFLASDYCFDIEMKRAMARHDAGTARVIPVIMKPSSWKGSVFSKLQVLPKDGKPVTRWDDQDEALLDVALGISSVVAERQQQDDQVPKQVKAEQIPAGNFIERLSNIVELEMVKISSGRFWMGSPDNELERSRSEGPQHSVNVSEFWFGKYPVTQVQWAEVAALPKVKCELKPFPSRFKGATLPVERVSWYEAVEFCQRLSQATGRSYRLPSEAEWEYACRAGTITRYSFGDTITDDKVNCNSHRETTTIVGNSPANAWGLYDMHGNVWEWCIDHWHNNYDGAPTNGSPWLWNDGLITCVVRGGSWSYYPRSCRSAFRNDFSPDVRSNDIGFRVVCSAPRVLS